MALLQNMANNPNGVIEVTGYKHYDHHGNLVHVDQQQSDISDLEIKNKELAKKVKTLELKNNTLETCVVHLENMMAGRDQADYIAKCESDARLDVIERKLCAIGAVAK